MRGMRNKRGITLIALVITIIIVFILAGTTINMITSQDGILNKTILAKDKMNEGKIEEKIKLAVTEAQINENGLDREELKKKLEKYFGSKYTLTVNSDSSCVINVDGIVIKVESNGVISNSKYEVATSEDGILLDASGDNILDYKIYGDSVQNGEPTPDNPVEIQSVGDLVTTGDYVGQYKLPVKVSGKNKFDLNLVEHNERTQIIENGIEWLQNGDVDVKLPAGRYTISFENVGTGNIYLRNGKVSNGYISIIKPTETYKTFTFESNVDGYLRLSCFAKGQILKNIQIEDGTTATNYEPYYDPIVTNVYLKEPLRKAGDYVDYINLKDKKIVRNMERKRLEGSLSSYTSSDEYQGFCKNMFYENWYTLGIFFRCNRFSRVDSATKLKTKAAFSHGDSSAKVFFSLPKSIAMSVDEAKTWLSENETYFIYPKETPIEEKIELPEVLTHKGTNKIEVDTTVKPSKIQMTYYKEK